MIGAAFALMMSGLAGEPPKTSFNGPHWAKLPSFADQIKVYPPRAKSLGLSGTAIMRCQVTAKGALEACAIVSETPADAGFGDALLKLAPKFRTATEPSDGQTGPVRAVTIPMKFRPQ